MIGSFDKRQALHEAFCELHLAYQLFLEELRGFKHK